MTHAAQHTPGPWHYTIVHNGYDNHYAVHQTENAPHLIADYLPVEADARLLAAVPEHHQELLRSTRLLKELREYLHQWNPDDVRTVSLDMQIKANSAAIAKAGGQAA